MPVDTWLALLGLELQFSKRRVCQIVNDSTRKIKSHSRSIGPAEQLNQETNKKNRNTLVPVCLERVGPSSKKKKLTQKQTFLMFSNLIKKEELTERFDEKKQNYLNSQYSLISQNFLFSIIFLITEGPKWPSVLEILISC